ncbi:MAG: 30S ribosomal protein S16 [Microgenomates group bacterium Gr01-1014_93]|nr:MAG: 30S ribosomal protein S16 [Microgenomates group bacterium Gr01-1014_93]
MLKIRLMRIGAKKRPFYRIVAVDERAKRTGGYIELLGTYNPLTTPHEINLKKDRIEYWTKQGAQLSDGFLRITGKAAQRPPRKPKKEKKTEEPKVEVTRTIEEPVSEITTANTSEVASKAKSEEDTSEVSEGTEAETPVKPEATPEEPATEEKEEK